MPAALSELPVHRMSLERYQALIEAGGFGEDERVELLEGVLVDMSPKGREHDEVIAWLNRAFVSALDQRFQVRPQLGLTFPSTGSAPEPDLAVVGPDAARPYHPADALLVIEVAASSLRIDRSVKARIYAAAGVPEYWVVDLAAEVVEVRVEPAPEGYGAMREARPGETLSPLALPGPHVAVAELFAAARR